jgi:hypothetical protein
MTILLPGHPGEQIGVGGEIRVQPLGEVAIDVGILVFRGDGEGQDLGFVQVTELNGVILSRGWSAGTVLPGAAGSEQQVELGSICSHDSPFAGAPGSHADGSR